MPVGVYIRTKPTWNKGKTFTQRNKTCKVKGCNKSAHYLEWGKRGYCCNHYALWRKHGDPTIKLCQPNGSGHIAYGYKLIYVNGKKVREHRYLMEQYLKHKLKPFPIEIVHHKNGIKNDNRIINLEVRSQSLHAAKIGNRNKFGKVCHTCKKFLPYSDFYTSKCYHSFDGQSYMCKKCSRIQRNKYR